MHDPFHDLAQPCETRRDVGSQVHAEGAPAPLGEHLEVAAGLRRFDHPEGEALTRHRQIGGVFTRDLEEHAGIGSALIGLARRMQEARTIA